MSENEQITPEEMNKALFIQLIIMLATSASQQMGKLVDPAAGKPTINLEAAQATIDLLDMLEAKTRGNLDKEEARVMKDTLMSLKLTFVDARQSAPPPPAPDEPKIQASESQKKTDDEEPRFHKKY